MKICFFTENSYKGGMDKLIYTLANNWPSNDDEITILCNRSHPGYNDIKEKLKPQHHINNSNILLLLELKSYFNNFLPTIIVSFISFVIKYLLVPYQIVKLYILFKKSDFDKLLIINGGYPGGYSCRSASLSWYLAKKKKSPMVCLSTMKEIIWYSYPFEFIIDKFLTYSVSKFIYPSLFVKKTQKYRSTFSSIDSLVIYNGIDQFPIIKNTCNVKNKNTTNFLMLATYEEHKGHVLLFDSIAYLIDKYSYQDYKFTIAGYGTDSDKTRLLREISVRNIGKYINFLDFQRDTYQLYKQSDAVIIPSIKYEALPLTALEAMSLEIPLITTDIGGLSEIFSLNYNIGLISSTSPGALSENIYNFITNKGDRENYGKNGYQTYKKYFTSEACAYKYHDVLNT